MAQNILPEDEFHGNLAENRCVDGMGNPKQPSGIGICHQATSVEQPETTVIMFGQFSFGNSEGEKLVRWAWPVTIPRASSPILFVWALPIGIGSSNKSKLQGRPLAFVPLLPASFRRASSSKNRLHYPCKVFNPIPLNSCFVMLALLHKTFLSCRAEVSIEAFQARGKFLRRIWREIDAPLRSLL